MKNALHTRFNICVFVYLILIIPTRFDGQDKAKIVKYVILKAIT